MKLLAALSALCVMALTTLAHADPPAQLTARSTSAPHAATRPSGATITETVSEGVVNVNTAGPDELVRVPGIGPSRADSIVRLRERVTRFRHVDDLLRVRGIGRVTLRHMRPFLAVEGPTTLAERPGRRRATE